VQAKLAITHMPQMNGFATIHKIQGLNPDVPGVLAIGLKHAARECMCRPTVQNTFAVGAATTSPLPTSTGFFARRSKDIRFRPTPLPII
jgi:hypothetical protein